VTSFNAVKGTLNMLKKFNHYFKAFISDRTEEISEKILYNNRRYQELNLQIIQVQRELTDNLPPRLQPLVDRYDDAETEQDGIAMSVIYRQGFLDGVQSVKLIKRFGTTVQSVKFEE